MMPTGVDCGSHSSPMLDELINARAPEGSHGFTDQYIHPRILDFMLVDNTTKYFPRHMCTVTCL